MNRSIMLKRARKLAPTNLWKWARNLAPTCMGELCELNYYFFLSSLLNPLPPPILSKLLTFFALVEVLDSSSMLT